MTFEVVLPILGFEDIKEFELEKINDNFYTLKHDKVTFTLINPFLIRNDYDFEISEQEQTALKIDENTNFLVLNIMIVNSPFIESTVNFAAPLIFNMDEKLMGQVILEKYGYGLTEPLKNFIKSEE
ncbi:flagellar assembly protein FliW [Nautilia lithotrophica]